ncbi:Eco57I restriction-modification methylase domain-containing protein [Nitratidesulfovibrio sp. SRB-5]|uniref:Eco57I restriction-modification methylase domain-containing protein n=1 Tax=Nitratidesulfovibrio sp. SRB-5 TaxID=2872636 RepID=UPI0010278F1A|nr:Eco57I restriction-modification methylase domain-containing protein [Nitratidesulfovibrio sp. SRB-5]MBZ2172876.1 Eco57I restriction-modification methylase domain-containing protein [Nitratidesulfovibrio sp. SRB-5]RXF76753.1 SAM-dependent methyltransferase [Desulfovibrio sp. DS-1]
MLPVLECADGVRRALSPRIAPARKSALGQFMTPQSVARFMASLFPAAGGGCRLLDAGAGVGALSCAFLDRWVAGGFDFTSVAVTAYEIDATLRYHLAQHLGAYAARGVTAEVLAADFIAQASAKCQNGAGAFTHAILNPPYKKINSNSPHRQALRRVGVETVNQYSAFVALSLELMAPGGHLVAILPRSFCNGPYYRPFREFLLSRAALKRMHLFESRNRAFKDDEVLQENIIILLERAGEQGDVVVSTSTDASFADLVEHAYPFAEIVQSGDPERFIHVPTAPGPSALEEMGAIRFSLKDLGIGVSTGPVVDFRLAAHLREKPGEGTVPLLYPVHFREGRLEWPKEGSKKPNAILRNGETEKWLYPNGFYCVVRRFSSKEERRRIMASVVRPDAFPGAEVLGLENHLNVYHEDKRGLPPELAHGLAVYLNSTAVDENFRRSSGHTQVNATDLKRMQYPSRAALSALGTWAMGRGELTQEMIDTQLEALTHAE